VRAESEKMLLSTREKTFCRRRTPRRVESARGYEAQSVYGVSVRRLPFATCTISVATAVQTVAELGYEAVMAARWLLTRVVAGDPDPVTLFPSHVRAAADYLSMGRSVAVTLSPNVGVPV
jgi:hypothetical protein